MSFEITPINLIKAASVQILVTICIGWLFSTVAWCVHNLFSPSCKVFRKKQYNSSTPGFSGNYRFVVVRYDANSEIEDAIFYTFLGDWIKAKYKDGKYYKVSELFFSNFPLILFPLSGLLLSVATNQELGTSFHHITQPSNNMQMFGQLGALIFFATFLSIPVKVIFIDFLYTKIYEA